MRDRRQEKGIHRQPPTPGVSSPAFESDAKIAENAQQPPAAEGNISVPSTQAYYRRVADLLEDLRQSPKRGTASGGGRTIAQNAVRCDSCARKIDKLPIVGVDPELVDFSANTLRQASAAIKQIGARKRVRQANTPAARSTITTPTVQPYSHRSGAAYGSSTIQAAPDTQGYARELSRISTEERVSGAANANEIFRDLAQATADIRRKMTQKYNVEF